MAPPRNGEVLEELAQVSMDFQPTSEQQLVRQTMREFAET